VREVYIASDNIITSLGFNTVGNIENMLSGATGIRYWEDERLSPEPYWASRIDPDELTGRFSVFNDPEKFTQFEQMAICSIEDALSGTDIDIAGNRTLFILATTKGNINLLGKGQPSPFKHEQVYLWHTARRLQQYFNFSQKPYVVSNACISGLLALTMGARMVRNGRYDQVVVTGVDIVTEFVLSGFNSFRSLETGPCRPFDRDRQGLSLGEGAGTVILTSNPSASGNIRAGYGVSSNDANHISGPSRTGEGLYIAIRNTMEKNGLPVDYISAHGTATPYNDEMESIALTRAGLQDVPVNSFKGYWGHTLGAAGVVESVAAIYSLSNNRLIKTLGFETPGVTHPIHVISSNEEKEIRTCLKIASGFGGCNAALLFFK
jgi:3-oxoacyl-[acyl-carrier-protein] synthase-1